jgi:glycerol kinase
MQYILSIDQGTTSSRAALISNKGEWVADGQRPFRQIYPEPGWVEHDAHEIWQTVVDSIRECLKKGNVSVDAIKTIGITNQRETIVMWDRNTGEPVYNAIVWQCRRSQKICEKLKKLKKEKIFKNKTGLVLDPYFSGTKIQWLFDNVKGLRARAQKGELAVGTIDTWLLWKLTAGESHKTDVSNASRTLLMNLKTLNWDAELCKILKVPQSILPSIHASNHKFGVTKNVPGLPDGIPIHSMIGDQQSALFGQNCFKVGEAKCTFGTGSFLLLNTGAQAMSSRFGSLTTVAWQLEGQKPTYALEGGAFICGAAVQWLRDGLGLFQQSADVEALAATVTSTQGVEFVPALTGLGAPHWKPEARGIITGLTRGSTKAHIARATLEAMALQNVDLLEAMKKDLKKPLKKLRVDGGASKNNLLMQMQSDYSALDVERPKIFETTALGAGLMAGLGVGMFENLSAIEKIWQKDAEFNPKMNAKDRKARIEKWLKAVEKA